MEATKFACPTRSTDQEINQATRSIVQSETFTKLLNLYPEIVIILDQNRQAVFCNKELLNLLKLGSPDTIAGKRPGEVFNCVNAFKEAAGCGTSEFCRECGAVKAILIAQTGKPESRECRITINTPTGQTSMDLRVWASPVEIEKNLFTFFLIRDIGDEKRRAALEHVFFHDILNDTAILKAYTENIRDGIIPTDAAAFENIFRFSTRLANAITDLRDLLLAEEGSYTTNLRNIEVGPMLRELIELYRSSPLARAKEILIQNPELVAKITTDANLLWRVIGNLLKNALEANPEQSKITVRFQAADGNVIFSVHGPAVMSDEVRHQIFQRSFSTKGPGRGLGTYSVKLFTEKYLKGKVDFESLEEKGTTFFVSVPA